MAVISHKGVDYSGKSVKVQSDASATSLNALEVPNGQTVTSFLNSKTYPNVVISNVDLNTVKTTGTYRLNGSITNSAYGNYGVLQVYATDTTVRQVQYTENPDDIYTRVFYNNAWTTWKQMVNVDYLNSNLANKLVVGNLIDLRAYSASTLIQAALNNGHAIYIASSTGGNRVSDLPVVQAGTYVVIPDTYYVKIIFFGANGCVYIYTDQWIAVVTK